MRLARSATRLVLFLLAGSALCGVARADGIDLGSWILQLPSLWSSGAVFGFVLLFLAIDYGLNLLVIGWPAKRWTGRSLGKIARDLVPYTIWAQLADRLGALLAIPATAALEPLLDKHSEGYFVTPLLVSKVVLSAIAIGFVIWRFARKRWELSRRRSWILCVAGSMLTNPGWGYVAAYLLLDNADLNRGPLR
jgi:hypothetical protein